MPRFYVTMTWDDWPEGGSYGTVVEAPDHETATEMVRREMAASRAGPEDADPDYCANCMTTDQDGSGVCVDCGGTDWVEGRSAEQVVYEGYAHAWHVVDCFDLDQFIQQHSSPVRIEFCVEDLPAHSFDSDRAKAEAWLANNAGSIRDRLAAEGLEWIEMLLEQDGILKEDEEWDETWNKEEISHDE